MSVLCDRAAVRSLPSARSAEQPALARAELVRLTTEASSAVRRSVCGLGFADPLGAGVADGPGCADLASAVLSGCRSGVDRSPTAAGLADWSTAAWPPPASPVEINLSWMTKPTPTLSEPTSTIADTRTNHWPRCSSRRCSTTAAHPTGLVAGARHLWVSRAARVERIPDGRSASLRPETRRRAMANDCQFAR